MKIIFLCGSLEPGKDGVGDYTRRLCGELIRTGHQTQMVSLCDKQASHFVTETQIIEETPVNVSRIPIGSSNPQRLAWTQAIINTAAPDWISLQFVPYSFHSKGLPYWLPGFLKELKGNHQWHIMFHEMWLGISVISPLKHKITGYFQRFIAKKIVNNILPNSITTSNILYQMVLKKGKISADILTLFSNIPKVKSDTIFKKELFANLNILEENLDQYLFVGVFGSIYPQANINKVLNDLIERNAASNKEIVFISFGFLGEDGEKEIERLKTQFTNKIKFANCGLLSEKRVSTLLQILNIGISCTPSQHVGKSGVFAAMKLHGLEVVMSSGEKLPEYEDQLQKRMPAFMNRDSEMWSVKNVANDFISHLKNN